ncbi:ABC transporter substrate-binding protein [Cohnella abietis]|uniref:Sugar ABC transporter substrate-binding protein n=1 Tax=Cohnella abietis TaxID=2507935 RepID=A0A3T1D1I8_9BACL|nr:ABC transporter substrate-binding protein [Cohnella abietis]BBI31960.1 sugar ABC transporter substrate-binding protein [Cohnella abietis]
MKKSISAVGTTILALTLLTACGGNNEADKNKQTASASNSPTESALTAETSTPTEADTIKGKITFAINRTDMDDKLKEYADKFHEKYPNAEVVIEPIKDYEGTLKIRLASNEAPDVMYMNTIITPSTDLWPDFYAPIDDLGYAGKSYLPLSEYEGHAYSISEGVYVTGVLYNKKTFADAGVTESPKTYDEFISVLETLKAKGVLPIGSMLKSNWPLSTWETVAFAQTADSQAVFEQMVNTNTPYTDENSLVKGFKFVRELVDKGYFEKDLLSSDWDVLRKQMASGKVGMLYLANYGLAALDGTPAEDVGFFPLPIDNSGQPVTMMTPGWNLVISKGSKNMDTAKAFYKFWIEESGYQDHNGLIPPLKDMKSKNAPLADFLSNNPRIVSVLPPQDSYNKILNKAQIGNTMILQEIMLNKDNNIQPILDKYNKKWADARK